MIPKKFGALGYHPLEVKGVADLQETRPSSRGLACQIQSLSVKRYQAHNVYRIEI